MRDMGFWNGGKKKGGAYDVVKLLYATVDEWTVSSAKRYVRHN